MKLRPYQDRALEQILRALRSHSSTMAVLATGLGKTVLFSHVALHAQKRVLIIAHRKELLAQAAEKIEAVIGVRPGVEMGLERSDEQSFLKSRVVVASVQTLSKPKRREKFNPADFGLIVIDEAHHAVAASYTTVIDYFRNGNPDAGIQGNPNVKVLGVTATPKRTDKLAMGRIFESEACNYGIEPALADGWLVPITQRAIVVKDMDFSNCNTHAGDLAEVDLERILTEEKVLHGQAKPTVELAGDRPTLVFCVNVAHAKRMAEVLCRYKTDSAVALDGETPDEERDAVVNRFRQGKIQFLVNCGLFLEGFDAPAVACVAMCRPTKSLSLYTQVLGRGTRPLPGVVDPLADLEPTFRIRAIADSPKSDLLVLDYVGNSGRHKIVTAMDVLGGKYTDDVRKAAGKIAESEAVDVKVALERAAAERELELEIAARDAEARRKLIRAQRVEYVQRDVSVFAAGSGVAYHGEAIATGQTGELATERQVWWLHRNANWQLADARKLTKVKAQKIIGKLRFAEFHQ
jgi:superfamily II DNA or RNA helicase